MMQRIFNRVKLNNISLLRNQKLYYSTETAPIAYRKINDVSIIHMHRPSHANALSIEMGEKLIKSIKYVVGKMDSSALIITGNYLQLSNDGSGSKNKHFSAGRDLKLSLSHNKNEEHKYLNIAIESIKELYNCKIPTIAAIEGACYGWGLELALACDMRIAHPESKLCFPETKLGIFPGAGGLYYLKQLGIPMHIIYELVYTAKVIDGNEAKELQLINDISNDPLSDALSLCEKFSTYNKNGLTGAKQVLRYFDSNQEMNECISYSTKIRKTLKLDESKIEEILRK